MPVLNEYNNISAIINNLLDQKEVEAEIIICVNQPDEWWNIDDKKQICEDNKKTLEFITSLNDNKISLVDRSSPGKGWIGKRHGVGWARKTAMDLACEKARDYDLIISVDADTWYPPDYFKNVIDSFKKNPDAAGFSAPYYHPLTSDLTADRCILRYEIYMRNYALNMLLINNPYAFSAIGSGMAASGAMYRKVRGLTPKLSGEDFYFVQKLRKAGQIIIDCDAVIYPASRFSDRVYFGTGPAMIKGRSGNWDSYPIYPQDAFLDVKYTFDSFENLYDHEVDTPMDDFLKEAFLDGAKHISALWEPLRKNSPNSSQFIKAATHKVDALRILQFLKQCEKTIDMPGEIRLVQFLRNNFEHDEIMDESFSQLIYLGFNAVSLTDLNLIRDFMAINERKLQRKLQLI